MRGQLLKFFFSFMIILLCLGSLMTMFIWYTSDYNHVKTYHPAPARKRAPKPSELCKGCKEIIDKIKQRYNQTWTKQEENNMKLRAELRLKCNGSDEAIITQSNTPVGSKLVYDGEKKRTIEVKQDLFNMFIKKHPFSNKIWDTCSVVGNSGILSDSGCGKMIDSGDFVVRCNLPPLDNGYEKDVGTKTNLVTANPSILFQKYGSLIGRRRPFIDSLRQYGSSLLLLPAFAFSGHTAVCQRAVYAIEDFESPLQPVFFNPQYLQNLSQFWRSQGLKEVRLSTGLMVASMALGFCENVHLYGFWPFSSHPYGLYALTNHYYDDKPANKGFHSMPAEFDQLLQLHAQGVIRLHLGDCKADGK
ncbi:alpha-2,8-sialyltransferase 8F-like [Archocentrus centrarchus]|uniref:alpha-2,8-sialyltransferase 8F-like n=1 Tax=Archocentrus centrarchus TaxID=63155 RepID=UPI0011E9C8C3|nr:alpha-2,8-sialyltransferase 8F-like [Archocentrus centrarchus]